MSTPRFNREELFSNLRRHIEANGLEPLNDNDFRRINQVIVNREREHDPNGGIGTNIFTAFLQALWRGWATIQGAFGLNGGPGFDFSNIGRSWERLNDDTERLGASRANMEIVTAVQGDLEGMGGRFRAVASAITGNVSDQRGIPLRQRYTMTGNLDEQYRRVHPTPEGRSTRLDRQAQRRETMVDVPENSDRYAYAEADSTQFEAPHGRRGAIDTNALTVKA